MVEPLNSFCCGCPLDTGVRLTLMIHLLSCIFYMATCFLNLVVDAPTIGYHVAPETQAFNCGFALASLPFIASGFSGVAFEIEIHLRIYLYWLLLTVIMDFFLYFAVLFKNSCATIPRFLQDVGSAFTCGFMRLAGTFFLFMFLVMMLYCAMCVWSRCEELELVGSERTFTDLQKRVVSNEKAMVYQHKGGLFGTGPRMLQPVRPVCYGSLSSEGYGGSVPIFGSETNHRSNRHAFYPDADIHDHPAHM